jgi:Acetyltransferase (GNAT) domain
MHSQRTAVRKKQCDGDGVAPGRTTQWVQCLQGLCTCVTLCAGVSSGKRSSQRLPVLRSFFDTTCMPVPTTPVSIRPYLPADFVACMGVFQSNVPTYFADSERGEFAFFLASPGCNYWVAECEGALVACGGCRVEKGVGRLCWGMVVRARHGASIGSALLTLRLRHLFNQVPPVLAVELETSQHSAGFFERFGFKALRVTTGGYGPGLDTVAMLLRRGDWGGHE